MSRRVRAWFKEGALALLLLVLVTGVADWLRAPDATSLSLQPLTTLAGERVDLAALSRDRPLLIYVWASWCGVCRFTGDAVQSLHEDGVPVLGIALRSGDDPTLSRYLARQGYDVANINDQDGAIGASLGVSVTPTFLMVKGGKVVRRGGVQAPGCGCACGWLDGSILRALRGNERLPGAGTICYSAGAFLFNLIVSRPACWRLSSPDNRYCPVITFASEASTHSTEPWLPMVNDKEST